MFDHSFDPRKVSTILSAYTSYPSIITPSEFINEKNEVEVMKKYEQYLNKYEKDLIPSSQSIDHIIHIKKEKEDNSEEEKDNELTSYDIDFLKNVIKIKVKIDSLDHELNEMYEKNKNIKEYTEELEELKMSIHKCNESLDTCNEKYRGLVTRKFNDELENYLLCSNNINYKDAEEFACIKTSIKNPNEKMPSLFNKENMNQINNINEVLEKNKSKYCETEYKICEIVEKIKMLKHIICTDENTPKKEPFKQLLCAVCNESQIKICIDSCGHCVCNECSKKMLSKCHSCKANIKQKIILK